MRPLAQIYEVLCGYGQIGDITHPWWLIIRSKVSTLRYLNKDLSWGVLIERMLLYADISLWILCHLLLAWFNFLYNLQYKGLWILLVPFILLKWTYMYQPINNDEVSNNTVLQRAGSSFGCNQILYRHQANSGLAVLVEIATLSRDVYMWSAGKSKSTNWWNVSVYATSILMLISH